MYQLIEKTDQNEEHDFILFIANLTNEHQYSTLLATKGLFLQDAYFFITTNIRVIYTEDQVNNALPASNFIILYSYYVLDLPNEKFSLAPISQYNIRLLKLWTDILYNFLHNDQLADYVIISKFEFLEEIFIFLEKYSILIENDIINGSV